MFTGEELAKRISELLVQTPSVTNKDVWHLLRFMLTGSVSGPSAIRICTLLGREEVIARIAPFSAL